MLARVTLVVASAMLLIAANASEDAATRFGVRESIENISLSPDGKRIAYLAPRNGQGSALYVVDLPSGEPRLVTAADGNPQRLTYCNWVSDVRLVCQIMGMVKYVNYNLPVSRLVAIDSDGSKFKLLSERANDHQTRLSVYGGNVLDWLPEQAGSVLMAREYIPESRGNTNINQSRDGYGVDQIDTLTGHSKPVEAPKQGASEFITDGHGRVRIMGTQTSTGGQMTPVVNYFFRTKGSNKWLPFSSLNTQTDVGLDPYAIDGDLDAAYALKKVDGRQTLVRVALDGTLTETPVFAHATVDVDGVVRFGRSHRVIGFSYITEQREVVYTDAALKTLAASLSRALPGKPLIRFAGASADETIVLVWAGSDTDPGRYYLFNRTTKKLDEILLSRPQLDGVTLASVKSVHYRAGDGTEIPAYLTLPPGSNGKNIPAIVLPHGGPSARDEWGFDWLTQFYAARGYAVLQPQFRGSSGYGDIWFKDQGFKKWAVAVGDVNDAGRWLVSQGIADPSKLAIVGWSYGGYAALQSNVVDPDLYKAVVAIAPVTDLALLIEQSRDYTNFALVRQFVGEGPHIRAGSPAQNAARFKAPVLIFQGDMDLNVNAGQARFMDTAMTKAGKPHEVVMFPGLDHYIEDSAARKTMLMRSDAFLRTAMKMPE